MIIGLVILGIVALLLLFGVAERVFKSFGVSYPFAFVMIGGLIGCAFIPTFTLGGAVAVNTAGFIAPLVLGIVFTVIAARMREGWRAAVTISATTSLYIAVRLLIEPLTSELVTSIVAGFLCGAGAYLIGKTKIAALSSVFFGFFFGELISSAVDIYIYGLPMRLGSAAVFDALVIAAVFSVLLYEMIAGIKRAMRSRNKAALCESAEEFDPDEYKRYFDE